MIPKLLHPGHLAEWRERILEERPGREAVIVLSAGMCGRASGALAVVEAFRKEIQARRIESKVGLLVTGCHGYCEMEPNAVILPGEIFYKKLEPGHAGRIIEETVLGGKLIPSLLVETKTGGAKRMSEIPFYKRQRRLLTERHLRIDPESLEDYIAQGGYAAFSKALFDMTSEDVIAEVKKSGLRGRGGAGFPTGLKWEFCRSAPGHPKAVVANGDEGDPGAYMDRSLLEANPHGLLEGLLIGAYAVGAEEGVVYIRSEYPLAVKNMARAVEQARHAGLLGRNILGSEFHCDVQVVQGAGAFVSGEETALIASIEGRKALPRPRPPFPAQEGLGGKPTNINNVETWANIPLIVEQGGEGFAGIGTAKSKGTKIFSLVGKVRSTGLVEVPMGTTLREIVEDIGGGVAGGRTFKAVQTGGPSGGCLPESALDLAVDYDTLSRAGAIMGSGGLIVMDDATCMVDVARYFLRFTQDESCGKCPPCRLGTRRMYEILTRITEGRGEEDDPAVLESLAATVASASLCGLGRTAPNPVLTTLRYFRDEYEAHIRDKSCPAGVCRALVIYAIDPGACTGCELCRKECPVEAISGQRKVAHTIDPALCIKCGGCLAVCPPKVSAVRRLTGAEKTAWERRLAAKG